MLLMLFCCPNISDAEGRSLKGVEQLREITLHPGVPFAVDSNLTIIAQEIVEEWMEPDRRSVIFITLQMQSAEGIETRHITFDEPTLKWRKYNIEYRGGWRDEVRLRVVLSQ